MRFLIIDDDAEYRQLLRYHLEVEWPEAIIDEYQPSSAGPLSRSFCLDDVDLILLAHPVAGDEDRFGFLKRLRERSDCPPILLFAAQSDEFIAVDALKAGAANFFPKDRVKHQRFIEVVRGEIRDERLDPTGTLLVDHKVLNGARKRRLVAKLYAGDLSSVYLAESEDGGERIALKVLRQVADAGGRRFDRFLQEYEVIASVAHPNVVRIFDLGVADDHAYIAMEYLAAGTLAERLQAPLAPAVALAYARQIAGALEAIHAAGVLHRDLKPANIMFRDADSLALIDFGLAKQLRLHAAITGTGQIFGTPYYMSPEQGHAEPTDERSDLYSLGCILYEMLTGERPFTASSPMGVIYRHAHAPRPRLKRSLVAFQPVLDRLLARHRLERYQSAAALLEDLASVVPD